ncbi:MAG: hypothetical protein ACRDHP_14590, partial [Ktedonobacterales bacterium]
ATATSLVGLLLRNIWLEITVSFPILLGGFLGGTQGTGLTIADYLQQAAAHPFAYAVGLILGLCAVALFGAAMVRAIRAWRIVPFRAHQGSRSDAALARRHGELALLVLGACYAGAFALSSQQDIFATPRYLLPLFTATPLVVAQFERALDGLRIQFATRAPAAVPIWLAPLLVALLCIWNLAGNIALTPLQTAARDHGIWVTGTDATLLRTLVGDRVHTVISNDYWEGMRLTFESGETIITVMMTPQGHPGFNRYQPYVRAGLADPRPAYLELTGTPEAARDVARFRQGFYAGYSLIVIGEYTILLPSPE